MLPSGWLTAGIKWPVSRVPMCQYSHEKRGCANMDAQCAKAKLLLVRGLVRKAELLVDEYN